MFLEMIKQCAGEHRRILVNSESISRIERSEDGLFIVYMTDDEEPLEVLNDEDLWEYMQTDILAEEGENE